MAGIAHRCARRRARVRGRSGRMNHHDDITSAFPPGPDRRRRPRVVIIGSGFGGLFAARALRRRDVDITIIGKTSHHLFQPLLYQVATGILSEGEIAPPTREILRRQRERPRRARRGHRHRPGRAHRHLDVLGPRHGAPLRRADRRRRCRAVLLRQRPLRRVRPRHEEHRRRPGAARPHLRRLRARRAGHRPGRDRPADDLRRRRRRARPAWRWPARSPSSPTARCAATSATSTRPPPASSCSTRAPGVLPSFGEKLGGRARRQLNQIGVEVQLGAMVTDVDAERHRGQGRRRPGPPDHGRDQDLGRRRAGQPAGPACSAQQSGAEVDRAGRIAVLPDLHAPRAPRGARRRRHDQRWTSCPASRRSPSRAAATPPRRSSAGWPARRPQGPFKYHDKGSMATISRFSAVADLGKLKFDRASSPG